MSRSRGNAGAVRIVCRDPRHKGTREWEQHGYRHVATLQLAERAENSEGPRVTLFSDDNRPDAPAMKDLRRDDGQWVFKFLCSCGRDVQRAESHLVDIAQRYAAAFPGRRVEIDLVRLG
jgi:hypothetical protein